MITAIAMLVIVSFGCSGLYLIAMAWMHRNDEQTAARVIEQDWLYCSECGRYIDNHGAVHANAPRNFNFGRVCDTWITCADHKKTQQEAA